MSPLGGQLGHVGDVVRRRVAGAVSDEDRQGSDDVGPQPASALQRWCLHQPDDAPRTVSALALHGHAEEALLCARECLPLTSELDERAHLRWLMALAQLTMRDVRPAVSTLTRALHEAPDGRWPARLAALLASARLLDGDIQGALQLRHQLDGPERTDDVARVNLLHFDAAVARFGHDSERAHSLLDAAEQRPAYDAMPGLQLVGHLLRAELWLGHAPLARRELTRAAPIAGQVGGMWLDWWHLVDCLVCYDLGDWDKTLRRADLALEAGVPSVAPALHGLCAIVHTDRGDAASASWHVEQSRAGGRPWGIGRFYEGIGLLGQAVTAELRGDGDEVLAVLRRIVDEDTGFGCESALVGLGGRVVRMALAAGDVPLAEELTRALELTRAFEEAGAEGAPDVLPGRAPEVARRR